MSSSVSVDVRHRAGDFELEVAFTLRSGIGVLFGPSGAGKSLTLALVAGLERPDEGRITIGDEVVADTAGRIHVPTQKRRVGMVFQEGLLLPHRNVLDNVALAVRDVSRRRGRRRAARVWLDRVGAGDLEGRRPKSLSGGERQRVALARGLAGNPRLLLLDEPLSALDDGGRRRLRSTLGEVVRSSGVPSLLVTHDAEEAEQLGDVVIAYEHGRVVGTRTILRCRDGDAPSADRAEPAGGI